MRGAAWLSPRLPVAADLDSHFRYLSGIFLALGVALLACIPRIEVRTERFRLIALAVMLGGVMRLHGALVAEAPSTAHLIAIGVELILTPLAILWQSRVASARRHDA